ncbi:MULTISPECIES: hypothetical protein [unclassified Bacillus (in: firmicutes)]|uniref:hypothetical protein n=1 Tax=unclassified Bacillus (in: firmicutes) TaxID=185979 RepID=UPI0008DEDC4E|nr:MULTISPECIES: hypothetical protein [unclassified Bacillus (in: firmicutes)]SFJ39841.1 hypothetical protein SAMN04488574_11217 [Bacillus sp. 71mf]SFT14935.1 hypothetical protein SAMN04488145_11417 [Bacillus sp. 103mf]
MEEIVGHVLAGIARGAVAIGEVAVDATKVIVRGTIGVVRVIGEALAEELVELALETIEGREKRKQRRFARHVEKLKGHDWFKVIYENVKCRDVIHTDKRYLHLLSKRRYVQKLARNENERKQFIQRIRIEAKVDDVIWDIQQD